MPTTTPTPSWDRTRTTGAVTLRVLRPLAASVVAVVEDGSRHELRHEREGVFVGVLPMPEVRDYRLEVTYADHEPVLVDDPYRFLPTLGEIDIHLIGEGRHEQLWTVLGAHVREYDGPLGPGARHVVRRVGAARRRRPARLRRQPLGPGRPPDALARVVRGLGAVRARRRARARGTSSRSSPATAGGC